MHSNEAREIFEKSLNLESIFLKIKECAQSGNRKIKFHFSEINDVQAEVLRERYGYEVNSNSYSDEYTVSW